MSDSVNISDGTTTESTNGITVASNPMPAGLNLTETRAQNESVHDSNLLQPVSELTSPGFTSGNNNKNNNNSINTFVPVDKNEANYFATKGKVKTPTTRASSDSDSMTEDGFNIRDSPSSASSFDGTSLSKSNKHTKSFKNSPNRNCDDDITELVEEDHGNGTTKSNKNSINQQKSNVSNNTKQSVAAAKRRPVNDAEVIDLLDSDDENDINIVEQQTKRARHEDQRTDRARLEQMHNMAVNNAAAASSYFNRRTFDWMGPNNNNQTSNYMPSAGTSTATTTNYGLLNQPIYMQLPAGFQLSWNKPLKPPTPPKDPPQEQPGHASLGQNKVFRLTLLNVNEFTIEGLSPRFDMPPTPITGLRVPIKQIARKHGKAIFEKDKDSPDGGKWHIPLGAYQDFLVFLRNDSRTQVLGIPDNQLKIAFLERARQEKGYPTPEDIMRFGIPKGLANALAPFQRGGVGFVAEKGGRALIADDMGLGKTIQGVASMAIYFNEWPVLVLCPSGARYHWENEFCRWLGVDSSVNKEEDKNIKRSRDTDQSVPAPLLHDWQVNVLTSARSKILPYEDTKVVICSYGLAPALIQSRQIFPRQFRCAIVDESHMLKNKNTKRTSALLPVLTATDRCVLLSGTPALARPMELWPQLEIIGVAQHGWTMDEPEFIEKYVKKGNSRNSAELHTMLIGTVMIRRLKNDILKTMPKKIREKAEVHVVTSPRQQVEFKELLATLREGKGTMGKLAKIHFAETARERGEGDKALVNDFPEEETCPAALREKNLNERRAEAENVLQQEIQQKFIEGKERIQRSILEQAPHLDPDNREHVMLQMEGNLRVELGNFYNQRMNEINEQMPQHESRNETMGEENETKRTSVLTKLYSLTGDVKVPLIVEMLNKWLLDPTKGKLCIFCHHISVLNAIQDGAELSNEAKSRRKYIRIDGATSPRQRQEQINNFQSDPSVRIALLGITAAGVAVTLTASSTVWFAELFWTPAIMIQAEDRCHRIGQNAQVRCLYFVAWGTLDDVLWKLIEKKFQDLGEFVEGKENQKIVVDRTFKGTKDVYSSVFEAIEDNDDLDELDGFDGDFDLQLDNDLEHEIEELGEEERKMLQLSFDPDEADSDDIDTNMPDRKMAAEKSKPENVIGLSEENAIALSDDEAEPEKYAISNSVSKEKTISQLTTNESLSHARGGNTKVTHSHENDFLFEGCRLYKMIFKEPKLGIELKLYQGRVVVAAITQYRIERYGSISKPAVGDILASITGHPVPLITNIKHYLHYIKSLLQRPPVEITFIEAPIFAKLWKESALPGQIPQDTPFENNNNIRPSVPAASTTTDNNDDVIDLIDDD